MKPYDWEEEGDFVEPHPLEIKLLFGLPLAEPSELEIRLLISEAERIIEQDREDKNGA